MKRLSKSGIEYLDYAWNFYSGCLNPQSGICAVGDNCWAKLITKRFPAHYPNGFKPTFYPEAFASPLSLKKPRRIGVCFMGDLFGDWVDPNSVPPSDGKYEYWISLKDYIFATIRACPQHTFLFLTKCPWNLIKWSPFPDNCWVGVSATDKHLFVEAMDQLLEVKAKVKFLSFEPLLNWGHVDADILEGDLKAQQLDWIIIGGLTCGGAELSKLSSLYPQLTPMPYGGRYTLQPKLEWVDEIVAAADKAGIPVFEKDNLKPLLGDNLRQEIPTGGRQ